VTALEVTWMVGGLLLVGIAVLSTIVLQRLGRVERRLGALEDEMGVTWAEGRLEKSVIRRVMTLELLFELRKPKSRPRAS
jgi:hypothetical protein